MGYAPRGERKTRLAEATWRVTLASGIGVVSVRTVAAEAKVSAGSLHHPFPSQAEPLEFSAELMVERAIERLSSIIPDPDAVEFALATVRDVLPLRRQTRREFEVNIALIAETPADPGLACIRDHAHA